jgi:hypothetical protein
MAQAEAWPEAQVEMADDVDPEALTVMASIEADFAAIHDGAAAMRADLDRAQAGAAALVEKRVRDWAEVERAGIDEPVMQADAQTQMEATAMAERAEADYDAGLEI